MRTEHVLAILLAFVTACGLLAPPGEYGSEWTNEGAADASSEDGG